MTDQARYAKGAAKEEEILDAALEVFSKRGPGATSLREIAEKVGLTPAGVLHYFGTKDNLYVKIVQWRGEVDWEQHGGEDGIGPLIRMAQHNATVPGIVELFMTLAAAAPRKDHPAHDFFQYHYDVVRGILSKAIADEQAAGQLSTSFDPETLARTLIALADGLQLQWLLDPSIDMSAIIEDLWETLKSVT